MFDVVAKDRYSEYVVGIVGTQAEVDQLRIKKMSDAMPSTDGIVLVEYFVREVAETSEATK